MCAECTKQYDQGLGFVDLHFVPPCIEFHNISSIIYIALSKMQEILPCERI